VLVRSVSLHWKAPIGLERAPLDDLVALPNDRAVSVIKANEAEPAPVGLTIGMKDGDETPRVTGVVHGVHHRLVCGSL